jgi:hypothetical protein
MVRMVGGTIVMIAMVAVSWAQPLGGPPGRGVERIEQWKKIRMIEMLDLKEDVSVRFFARLNEHEKEKRELRKARGEVMDRLERLIRVNAPPAEFEKAFADLADADARLGFADREFFNGLADILTIEQRAKMVLFERRFEGELKEAMREQFRRRRSPEEE